MKTLLRHRGFQSFLWTQFLGALNDNLYKMIVSLRAVYVAAQTGQGGEYLSIALGVFSIPFLMGGVPIWAKAGEIDRVIAQ